MKDNSNILIKDMYSDKPDVILIVKNAAGSTEAELWYSPIPKYKSKGSVEYELSTNDEHTDSYDQLISTSRRIGLAILNIGLSKK